MKNYIDLTLMLDENYLPYPGDEPIKFNEVKKIDQDGYNLKRFESGMHIGTHMDAEKHIFPNGKGIESIDINEVIGTARVIRPDIEDNLISTEDIVKDLIGDEKILLLDLGHANKINTDVYYNQPKFQKDLVPFLVEKGIRVIGFDIPSPEYCDGDFLDMHRDLMRGGIHIIENLTNLDKLDSVVEFIALPLKIKGLDGSLIRAVACNNPY